MWKCFPASSETFSTSPAGFWLDWDSLEVGPVYYHQYIYGPVYSVFARWYCIFVFCLELDLYYINWYILGVSGRFAIVAFSNIALLSFAPTTLHSSSKVAYFVSMP